MLTVQLLKKLPNFQLNISFSLKREILVLFGPSGAGKSLTLSCIAGLVQPDDGLIQLGQQTLFEAGKTYIPLHKRGIGVVFQEYALFPHLTVAQNLAYGLRYHRNIKGNVAQMLHRLRLENLAGRYPAQLSGGQQQRVALGRALIIQPRLLLLDEPFAALDRGVREHLQEDIALLQRELGLTVIYVTHSLEDAFVLGDKLAVLQAGQLRQIGPISEVFHQPNSRSVAEITGVQNIWRGQVVESTPAGLRLQWGETLVQLPPADRQPGQTVLFYIRPEDVKIIRPEKPLTDIVKHNLLKGVIENITDRGVTVSVKVVSAHAPDSIQLRFRARSYQDLNLHIGQQLTLSLIRDAITLLPIEW